MYPIEFPEQNCVYAENQNKYFSLPSHETEEGEVISCWKFSWKERLRVLFSGKLWLHQLSFGSPLQPQLPEVVSPFEKGEPK